MEKYNYSNSTSTSNINLIDYTTMFMCFLLTYISQSPKFWMTGISGLIQLIWIVPIIWFIVRNRIVIDEHIKYFYMVFLIFALYVFTMEIISKYSYIDTATFKNYIVVIGMITIGYYYANHISESNFIKILAWASLVGGIILSYTIYVHSFQTGFDINSKIYAYRAKNSASQILFSTLIINIVLFSKTSAKINLIKITYIFFCIFVILIMKSRATILAFSILFFVLVFNSNNRKLKAYTIIITSVLITILLTNYQIQQIIIKSILYGSKDANDLNALSSGRFNMLMNFPTLLMQNPILGLGKTYIESFPLSILLEYGIIGSIPIVIFLIMPIKFIHRIYDKTNLLSIVLLLLILTYYLNGLFEQQAPFGPGAKCYLLWFIFGFLYRKNIINNFN